MGGRYGDDTLVVAVQAPAVDGRATQAALKAVATAFGLPARDVRLIAGNTSRTKIVELAGEHAARWAELLGS